MSYGAPFPPPQGSHASLNPPSNAQRADQGMPWYREQVFWPTPWFPAGPNIGLQLRRRVTTFLNQAINVNIFRVLSFDIPTTVYGLTAGIRDSTGAALPVAVDPLDHFTVQFQHTNGDNYDTAAGLGGALLGRASEMALLGGPGWMQDRGTSVSINFVPLLANLQVDIALWGIEVRGPANYQWPSKG